jgi:hypothetical protein
VLNRSFRRTLEAENKSPQTIEADTDAFFVISSQAVPASHVDSRDLSMTGPGS